MFGTKAVELLAEEKHNQMIIWKDGGVKAVPLDSVVKEGTTLLDPQGDYVRAAVATGMYVGEIK